MNRDVGDGLTYEQLGLEIIHLIRHASTATGLGLSSLNKIFSHYKLSQ